MSTENAIDNASGGQDTAPQNTGGQTPASIDGSSPQQKKPKMLPPIVFAQESPYFRAFNSAGVAHMWPNTFNLSHSRTLATHRSVKVFRVDSLGSGPVPVLEPWTKIEFDDPSDMTIYVEDLTPEMIAVIGSAFQIFPQIFEDHLEGGTVSLSESADLPQRMSWPYEGGSRGKKEYLKLNPSVQKVSDHITLTWFSVAYLHPLLSRSTSSGRNSRVWEELHWGKHTDFVDSGTQGSRDVNGRILILERIYRRQKKLKRTRFGEEVFACEEKATFAFAKVGARKRLIILLDPKPTFVATVRNAHQQEPSIHRDVLESRQSSRSPLRIDCSDWEALPSNIAAVAKQRSQSTYSDMQCWMAHWKAQSKDAHPLDALFEVIRIDTLTLIALLDTISREALTALCDERGYWQIQLEVLLWEDASLWASSHLPALRQSLIAMANLVAEEVACCPCPPHEATRKARIGTLVDQVDDMSTRIRTTTETINSAMALRHSRKGIDEAENIKRLSELAFFFIPLTFAAAIFSIQTEEFQKRPPQAWAFVITALSLVSLVYIIRMAVRRAWHSRVRRLFQKYIIVGFLYTLYLEIRYTPALWWNRFRRYM